MHSRRGMRGASSHAKVNLFLEVTDKRPDGYHDIDSVFVEVDLRDYLFARKETAPGIELVCTDSSLPADERNLAVKAANLLRTRCGVAEGLSLCLHKNIPRGAGLGGGSANAALALRLADALWETRLDETALAEMALEIGSDVPFFLRGGTCLCEGRGEVMTPLPDFPESLWLVLALPDIHSDTARAYRGLNLPAPGARRSSRAFVEALAGGDAARMEREAFNRFEETVFADLPDLARLHAELEDVSGRPVRMSGSGSGLWFFADASRARETVENGAVAAWAKANAVGLHAVPARSSTATGSGDILLDIPPF